MTDFGLICLAGGIAVGLACMGGGLRHIARVLEHYIEHRWPEGHEAAHHEHHEDDL